MGSSSTSCPSHTNVHHQRKPFPVECRPRMLLKDFLNENSNSCSSSGFKSFPRQIPLNPSNPPSFIEVDSKPRISNPTNSKPITRKLLRSRSKAASTTISAFHSLINAVKNVPFTTRKPPSFLARSFSRRMLQSKESSSRKQSQHQVQITVRVKDIIRWRSFRDEKLQPPPSLEFASSPLHCTTATTTCTTCSSSSSSNGSSWCDSDFTAEFLPPWGENEAQVGKKDLPCVGRDSMEATTGTGSYTASGPEVDEVLLSDQDEQHSPVSVFQFGGEDEESFSNAFDQSLGNVEWAKEMLMQKNNYFEILATVDHVKSWIQLEDTPNFEEEDEVEEKAMELLDYVKATSSTLDSSFGANMEDQVLLAFFKEEISAQRKRKNDELNWEMVAEAKAWVSGIHNAPIEWGQEEHKKEACVRDMHKGGGWRKFGDEQEQEELALEIENAMSEYLVDELLLDLLSS